MKRVATIGDCHGCIDELEIIYRQLQWLSLDAIRHAGDLVDRGPDSGACVQFCRENNIEGVLGNHESVLYDLYRRLKTGASPSPDKARSIRSIRSEEDWKYLRALPYLHIDDELGAVYVHGGIYPQLPPQAQPPEILCRLQMLRMDALIHRERMGKTRWFGIDRDGRTEEQNRAEGWVRWYEVCDHPYYVVYGHSVFKEPKVFNKTIGVDTGCVFGNALTAVVLPDLTFVSVPAKKRYAGREREGYD